MLFGVKDRQQKSAHDLHHLQFLGNYDTYDPTLYIK